MIIQVVLPQESAGPSGARPCALHAERGRREGWAARKGKGGMGRPGWAEEKGKVGYRLVAGLQVFGLVWTL